MPKGKLVVFICYPRWPGYLKYKNKVFCRLTEQIFDQTYKNVYDDHPSCKFSYQFFGSDIEYGI